MSLLQQEVKIMVNLFLVNFMHKYLAASIYQWNAMEKEPNWVDTCDQLAQWELFSTAFGYYFFLFRSCRRELGALCTFSRCHTNT